MGKTSLVNRILKQGRDRDTSPFELGKAIKLRGFSLAEANNLTLGLTGVANSQQALSEILEWTGGQPFLTQKLCQLVAEAENKLEPNLVTQIINRHIIDNWEVQDEPEHLRTIRDRLCYRDGTKTIRLLGIYQDILAGKRIAVNNSPEQIELRLSGLVTEANGVLQVSNKIYAKVFDRAWIEAQLSKLRPYSQALILWLNSDRDSAHLLQEKELQDALTWSLNKSLADIDYQFLVASQYMEVLKTPFLLLKIIELHTLSVRSRQFLVFPSFTCSLAFAKADSNPDIFSNSSVASKLLSPVSSSHNSTGTITAVVSRS